MFILEPSVFIPKGGYSRTFQLEGILLPCLYFKFLTTSAAPCCRALAALGASTLGASRPLPGGAAAPPSAWALS